MMPAYRMPWRRSCTATTTSTSAWWTERVAQFRDQTRRFLAGELTEDEFRPLRLQNGLYIQRYAPMLRVAIPYGLLSSRQLRKLAHIARKYDRGYGHFTTRQNIQFNWPKLEEVPDILAELATVEMHAIQTSRQLRPQHHHRPFRRRGAPTRSSIRVRLVRADPPVVDVPSGIRVPAAQVQDRGQRRRRPTAPRCSCTTSACTPCATTRGEVGFRVIVGGGLGRTPIIGHVIREFLPWRASAHLPRGDPARLQPLRPARQHVQGAHQDPGEGAGRRRSSASRSRPSGRSLKDGPATVTAGGDRARRRRFTRPRLRDARRRRRRLSARRLPTAARSRAGSKRNVHPHKRAGLRRGDAVAQEDRRAAGRRDRRPDGRASPSSPTATASASCASRTSRT